ncbi:MAG: DUF3450 family protein [Opitutales bacterium]
MKKLLTLCLLAPVVALGQGLSGVRSEARQDLEEAMDRLAEVRAEVQDQKIPLASEVAQLEEQVIQQRRRVDELTRIQDAASIDLNQIQRLVEQLREQQGYVTNLLNEFATTFNQRLHVSENPLYADVSERAINAPNNPELSPQERLDAQLDVVDSALERMDALLGGRSYEGVATAEGAAREGEFLYYGPTVFFASDDGMFAGYAQREANATEPTVVTLEGFTESIAQTIQSGEGELPLDGTLGRALRIKTGSKSLVEYIQDGEIVGYLILALGAIALLIAFFKIYEISTFKAPQPKDVAEVLNKLDERDPEAAKERANAVGGAGASLLETGARYFNEKRSVIEELMFERVLHSRPVLERYLPFLAITAAVAPLAGLFGTVLGMIQTFELITLFGTGDAKSLSGGISVALITTALGLVVAIPILIIHGILLRMAKKKVAQMEQAVVAFINGVAVSPARQKAE